MSEEIKVVKNEGDTEETTKVGFGTKLKNGVKKHGKKIVAGAMVIGGVLLGYALGKKSNVCDDYEEITEEDDDCELVDEAE